MPEEISPYGYFAVRKFRRKKLSRMKFSLYGNFIVYVFYLQLIRCLNLFSTTSIIDVKAFARLKDSMHGTKRKVLQN